MLGHNERRKARRLMLYKLLGGKCSSCGSRKNLEFDHLDPNLKEFRISSRIDAPEEELIKEVEKCVLLCHKCHVKKTLENNEFGELTGHGTRWNYGKNGCRCQRCKQAVSDYYHKRKLKKLLELSRE